MRCQQQVALERSYEQIERRLGRSATDEEVASALGIGLHEYGEWLEAIESDAIHVGGIASSQAMVARAYRDLPRREQVVLALYHSDQLTFEEIAAVFQAVLDMTPSQARRCYVRAMLHIRAKLSTFLELENQVALQSTP